MLQVDLKALVYGVLAYPLLYILYLILINVIVPSETENPQEWIAVLISISSWFALLLPGYISGRISKDRGIFHGFIVGLVAGVISAIAFAVIIGERWYGESLVTNVIYYISYIVFIASVGGGLGQLQSKYKLKA
jgi:putative membrane protein (TIGR04086 family)